MSVTKEIREYKPCVSNKTIQLIKNIWTSSKYQLPPARIFHYTGKCTLNGFRMGISRPISLIFLEKKFNKKFLACYEGCTLGYSTGNFFLNSFQCCPVYLFFHMSCKHLGLAKYSGFLLLQDPRCLVCSRIHICAS